MAEDKDIYKAFRNFILNELGTNKGELKSYVRQTIFESLDMAELDSTGIRAFIQAEIAAIAEKGFTKNAWYGKRSFEDIVREEIQNVIREELRGSQLLVDVSFIKKEPNKKS